MNMFQRSVFLTQDKAGPDHAVRPRRVGRRPVPACAAHEGDDGHPNHGGALWQVGEMTGIQTTGGLYDRWRDTLGFRRD